MDSRRQFGHVVVRDHAGHQAFGLDVCPHEFSRCCIS
jgi:hypothetical protein